MSGLLQRACVAALCAWFFLSTAWSATVVWTGGGTNNNWTATPNWGGNPVPGSGDTASFDSTSSSRNPTIGTNSLGIGSIDFTGSLTVSKTISTSTGGLLTIYGSGGVGVTNSSGLTQTIAPVTALGGSQSWVTSGTGSNLTFNGANDLAGYTLTINSDSGTTVAISSKSGDVISSSVTGGAIVKNGAGTLTFGNVVNTFDGGFTLNDGTVVMRLGTSFGTGTITLTGGTLNTANDKTGANAIANTLAITGATTISGAAGIDYQFSSNSISNTVGASVAVQNTTGSGTVTTLGFSGSGFNLSANLALGDATELRILNTSGTQTYSGTISGTGVVHQNAAGGTGVLSGTNTYTGGTLLDAGTLEISNASALGTGLLNLSGGNLTVDGAYVLGNDLTLSSSSTITATSGVEFTSGNITGTSGTLTIDSGSAVTFSGSGFTFARAIALGDSATVLYSRNTSGTQTFSGAISGAGQIVHDTAGTLVLGTSNSLSGGVTLSSGSLDLGNSGALGSGTLTLAGGTVEVGGSAGSISSSAAIALTGNATLGGTKNLTFTGGLAETGSHTLATTNTATTTFSTGSIVLAENNAARTLTLDVDAASGGLVINSVIADGAGSGADGLVKDGGGTLTLNGTNTYSGTTTLNAGTVFLGNDAAFGTGAVLLNGANLDMTTDRTLANNVTFGANTTVTGLSYSDLLFTGNITTTGGTLTLSNTSGSGTLSVGFSGSGFNFSDGVNLSGAFTELRLNSTGAQTFSGTISGSGIVHQQGSGTATLSGNNTFSGGVLVDSGAVALGSSTALGTGTLTLHGGTLSSASSYTLANDLNLTASSAISVAAGANLAFSSNTIGGNSGTLTLSNSSGSGTAEVTFTGNGFNFNRAIAFNDANTELHSANATGTQTFSAAISGNGPIVHDTAGELVLSATNTFTGGVELDAGTLTAGSNTALGTGTLTLNGGTLQTDGSARTLGNAVALTGSSTLGGTADLTLTGGLTQTGSNTLSVTNTGATTLSSGAVVLADNNQARDLTVNVAGTSGGLTISSNIQSGPGSGHDGLIKTGTGTLTLSGTNTFDGVVTVNAGTLVASGTTGDGGFAELGDHSWVTGPTPTTVITVNNGATLSVNSTDTSGDADSTTHQYETLSLSGSGVGGVGALLATGGTNTWWGNITLAGDTTIANSAVTGDGNSLYLGPLLFSSAPTDFALNGHALTLTGSGDIQISNSIVDGSGTGGSIEINLSNPSALVYFNGVQNTYTGTTTLDQGTLLLLVDPGLHLNSAVTGNLVIGDGSGAADSATVTTYYSDQIADTSAVTINADGRLDLATYGRDETIGALTLNGGHVVTNGANYGNLYLGGDVHVTASSVIDGDAVNGGLNLNSSDGSVSPTVRTFNVDSGATLTVNAVVHDRGDGFIKDGTGTMILTRDSTLGYAGVTEVKNGILNIQNSNALGQNGGGDSAKGTVVDSGATLQLQNNGSDIAVGPESLNLSGTGYTSLGALESVTGTNSWAGLATLNADSTINTAAGSLNLSGQITGSATVGNTQTLIVTGSGDTTISSRIFDNRVDAGTDSHTAGALALTKEGSGTLTLSNSNSFTGAVNVNAGTLNVTANDGFGYDLHNNTVSVQSGATLGFTTASTTNTIAQLTNTNASTGTAGGVVNIVSGATLVVNPSSQDYYGGTLSGSGLFEKEGHGTFTFTSAANTSAFNFAGTVQLNATSTTDTLEFQGGTGSGITSTNALYIGTLDITGGTLKLSDAYINVGTLNITGNTIIDFGTVGASVLNASNIYIGAGVTVTIENWTSENDFLFATNVNYAASGGFRLVDGSGTLANFNQIGVPPENQVDFQGDSQSPDGSHTTWINYNYNGFTNWEIRPIPEPSAYGALLLAASAALLLCRRRRAFPTGM